MSEPTTDRPLRVLVVEGHEDCAASTALLLRLYGHDVEVARDGAAGLAAAARRRPDVVLLEIGLPGRLDGWALARALRESAEGRPHLLIAVSGHGREEDVRRSLESGIDIHLVKPADPELLERILRGLRGLLFSGG